MRTLSLILSLFLTSACAQQGDGARGSAGEPARSNRGSSAVTVTELPATALTPGLPVVLVDDMRALGASDATVAIVEFADYQCPYCRVFHDSLLPKLRKAYIDTGKLRYFYKDLPLRQHRQAFAASVAAHCAGAQGKFWPMHEQMYANQAELGQAPFVKYAAALSLDIAQFKGCQKSAAAQRAVHRDMADARRVGVSATPTILLGRLEGNRVTVERLAPGNPAFDVVVREIEALLGKPGS